jgi:BioD-like phosphotransacetylase family protein
MVSLYITSTERYAGKTLLIMGLIDRFRKDGFKVGYFQPMGHFPVKVDDRLTDRSTWLVHRLFELEEPLDIICPVVVTRDLIIQNLKEGVTGVKEKMENAFEKISHGKDVVVVGCDDTFSEGSSFGISGVELIEMLKAHALFVTSYSCEPCIDLLLELKKFIGNAMIGAVFNRVAALDMDEIKDPVTSFLSRKDVEVYGSIPLDAVLGSLGVGELADHLGADVVCGKDNMGGMVENFLVGGMQVDKFISYLLKSPSSGIIVGGDRTDIQLVAIENGVTCLILSGNLYPNATIVSRAETKGVPILVVRDDTFTVAKNVEAMVGQFKLEEKEKIDRGMNLVGQAFDFEKLYKRLNLVTQ